MAKKREAPSSVFQLLLRAAKDVARADDPVAAPPEPSASGTAKAPQPSSEYGAVVARLAVIDEALKLDLPQLARDAVSAAASKGAALRVELDRLKASRSDHEKRRRELAEAADGYDWTMVHRDKKDFIGPLTLEHTPERSTLHLAATKLRSLDYPSGAEVFAAVRFERRKLDDAARSLWPKLRERALSLQGAGGTATWLQLVKAFEKPDRKLDLLYALVLLRRGALEPGWSLSTQPPALAQQSSATFLPRIEKPGTPDRFFALRVEGPGSEPAG